MPQLEKRTILIVDDDIDMQIYLSTLLSGKGFTPVVAQNEIEGFEKALTDQPDLIIMSMMIKGEMCIRFYNRLREHPELHRIPVMMLSSIQNKTIFHYHRSRQFSSGRHIPPPDLFLSRPPEAAELTEGLAKLLNAGQLRKRRKADRRSGLGEYPCKGN
ncbi:MAG: response regulator [Desulfobacterales bacterium]